MQTIDMTAMKSSLLISLMWLAAVSLPIGAQAQNQRVSVLTPRLSFEPALDGLSEGLERLGFRRARHS